MRLSSAANYDGPNSHRKTLPTPRSGASAGPCMTRHIDLVELLHLLGHELRSPAGVLLGYLRMLQEGRFANEEDRFRTYEKMRAALGRVAGLGDNISQLIAWVEPRERAPVTVDARGMLDRSLVAARSAVDREVDARLAVAPGAARLRVLDGPALESAVAVVIHATAREAGDSPVVVRASVREGPEPALEVVVGPETRIDAKLPAVPDDGTEAFSVSRGGMGLTLVLAVAVLDAHAARVWSIGGARSLAGLRFPVVAEEHES